jgi:hypothetical protein
MQLHEVNLKQSKIDRWIDDTISDNPIWHMRMTPMNYFGEGALMDLFTKKNGQWRIDRMIVPVLP